MQLIAYREHYGPLPEEMWKCVARFVREVYPKVVYHNLMNNLLGQIDFGNEAADDVEGATHGFGGGRMADEAELTGMVNCWLRR